MLGDTLTWMGTLTIISCGECSIHFAIPDNMLTSRKRDGENFWCPSGHKICYGDNENKRLMRERDRAQSNLEYARASRDAARDQASAAERRRAAAQGQVTKIKRRVANGVCPACHRTFPAVADHMTTEHPDYVQESK